MLEDSLYLRPAWAGHLEVVGSELFLRYRKRLLEPGISWQIWRDYPGLCLPDVWVRVHAARQILRNGDDFAVLAAIRRGEPVTQPGAPRRPDGGADPASRAMVNLGRVLFVLFCLLSLTAVFSSGDGQPWQDAGPAWETGIGG